MLVTILTNSQAPLSQGCVCYTARKRQTKEVLPMNWLDCSLVHGINNLPDGSG